MKHADRVLDLLGNRQTPSDRCSGRPMTWMPTGSPSTIAGRHDGRREAEHVGRQHRAQACSSNARRVVPVADVGAVRERGLGPRRGDSRIGCSGKNADHIRITRYRSTLEEPRISSTPCARTERSKLRE